MEESTGKRTIAKNTLAMYVRMFYGMIVSLFTARYILQALGEVDYGIYNVVGSIVSMFIFLRTVMGGVTYRYVAFSLGQKDKKRLNEVFSTSVVVFLVLAISIVLLCETVGLWLFYNKLNIPLERQGAAFWCFQISVVTCFISIISGPYDAEIVAHEKLTVYAITQIFQSTFNLIIAILLLHGNYDKLILYALLVMAVQLAIRFFYGYYCSHNFEECHFQRPRNKKLVKDLTNFAGWTLLRHMTRVLYEQGSNILLNMFYGPIVNTAKGIAQQVRDVIYGFVSNFQLSARAQITKSYAAGETKKMTELVFFVSRISYYLLLIIMLPVFVETPKLLEIWLGTVPNHTVNFIRLNVLLMFVQALDFPLGNVVEATGRIKKYNIVVSIIQIFIFVFSYLTLKAGANPESVYVVQFAFFVVILITKLIIVHHQVGMSVAVYVKHIILQPLLVTLVSAILPVIVFFKVPDTLIWFFVVCSLCVITVGVSALFLGFNREERQQVKDLLVSAINKKNKQ